MECSRCGGEAVVKRDNAVYCGKCALARDWEEVIHVVQRERVRLDKPNNSKPASKSGETSPENDPVVPAEAWSDGAPADPFA